MNDTTPPNAGSQGSETQPTGQLQEPRTLPPSKKTIYFGIAVALVLLVSVMGFQTFGGCGKSKVGGKTICQYETALLETEDEEELVELLGKVGKFGAKGESATDEVVNVFHDRDEDSVRQAAVSTLKLINKKGLGENIKMLLSDDSIEMSTEMRTQLLTTIVADVKPEEYRDLLQAAVGDDLERVLPLMQVFGKYVHSRKDPKGKKGDAYVNGLVDALVWIGKLGLKEGELDPPASFIQAKAAALGMLVYGSSPILTRLMHDTPFSNVGEKKLKEIAPQIDEMVESYVKSDFGESTEAFFLQMLAITRLIEVDQNHGFDELPGFIRKWSSSKFVDDEFMLAMPLMVLLPPDCVEKLGVAAMRADSGSMLLNKKRGTLWKSGTTDKLIEFMRSFDGEPQEASVVSMNILCWSCKVPGIDKLVAYTFDKVLDGGIKLRKVPQDVGAEMTVLELLTEATKEKMISMSVAKRYLERLSHSKDGTVRRRAESLMASFSA